MNPIDCKLDTYIDSYVEYKDKDPKVKVGDQVRRSKYKNIFTKGCTPNWSVEVFVIKKDESMKQNILMVKKILEHFMKKNCKR